MHRSIGISSSIKKLASPGFGERMAIWWLDLVRYADTVGYHGDQEHHAAPYRDWVIRAFNDNIPFNTFSELQLAGDLIPEAGELGKVASAYNRLLQTSHEGGVQRKNILPNTLPIAFAISRRFGWD